MKHVRLPIFDGDTQLREEVYVSVELLERMAATSTIYKDHVRVVQQPAVELYDAASLHPQPYPLVEDPVREQIELDYLDRVVHDLPVGNDWLGHALSRTDKTNPWREHNRREFIGEFAKPEEPQDVSNIYTKMEWRTLEDFPGYQMNKNRMIIDRETQKTVPQTQGDRVKVLLFDGRAGRLKTMAVEWLFRKTFPELHTL